MKNTTLAGVYVAAVTPLDQDFKPDLDSLPSLLAFYAHRGCHGALLLGTTGEGPSFAPEERVAIFQAAVNVRQEHPEFRLLAGTGTPSLEETISLTRAAFDLGFDGAVVLPPYYFRNASDEGLFAWYASLIERAVPTGGALLGYHIPAVSGVPLSLDLLARLRDACGPRFAGLKDSSGDPEHAHALGTRFGEDLLVLNGNDRLFSLALQHNAGGCITALANLLSPDLRRVWEAHQVGGEDPDAQARLELGRQILDRYQPAAPTLKAVLSTWFDFPLWSVRPPLLPLSPERVQAVVEEFASAGLAPA